MPGQTGALQRSVLGVWEFYGDNNIIINLFSFLWSLWFSFFSVDPVGRFEDLVSFFFGFLFFGVALLCYVLLTTFSQLSSWLGLFAIQLNYGAINPYTSKQISYSPFRRKQGRGANCCDSDDATIFFFLFTTSTPSAFCLLPSAYVSFFSKLRSRNWVGAYTFLS